MRPRRHNLPMNLYRSEDKSSGKIYYAYRDPRTGKRHGLGLDREQAIADTMALNSAIYSSIATARISSIVENKPSSPTFGRVLSRHLELCEKKRKLAANTLKNKASTGRAWEKALGPGTHLSEITVRKLVEVLDSYEDRPRMALAMRSAAVDIWKDAVEEGWADDNLAAKTRAPTVTVKRSRLTLEDFLLIHAKALTLDAWIPRAMELALLSSQRREDIAAIEFRRGKDTTAWVDDRLYVIQGKTGNKVSIPLDTSIAGFNLSTTIKACRDNVVSRWLVHHIRPRTLSKPGDQVWIDTITKGFARARDLAGVKGENGKMPPTFHEIRSLSIRLYTESRGADFAQAIAGHKDAATTAIYRDVRGDEWVKVG
ncbi:MAG: phage integrase Arm DNA-binding domain-containing protein [Sideroxydans sp.]|nr:phage integrase Arm DNA-binding domain-containing protein [Sideroxydans sp.]